MTQKVKIRFDLEGNPVSGETIWAEVVGENLYRLINIPFYAEGYALGDIIYCQRKEEQKEALRLEKDSGNGTIRIYFQSNQEILVQEILEELGSIGCQVEKASDGLVAVSVPFDVEVPFSQIANYLNSISNDIMIGWEIGKRINRNIS
mgnify:CR=1 FL=1